MAVSQKWVNYSKNSIKISSICLDVIFAQNKGDIPGKKFEFWCKHIKSKIDYAVSVPTPGREIDESTLHASKGCNLASGPNREIHKIK